MSPESLEGLNSISRAKRILAKFILLISFAFLSSGAAQATISYTIDFSHPENHLFHVGMMITDVHRSVTVQMPAWNATYQIRDFASRIQNLRGTDKDERQLPVRKIDKQTWIISGETQVEISYDIFWDEPGPFASQLNSTHAFMNLAEILVYIPDRRSDLVSLSFRANVPPNWKMAGALPMTYVWRSGQNRVLGGTPATYDTLVDTPIEFCDCENLALEGMNPPVNVAVHGENYNKRELE